MPEPTPAADGRTLVDRTLDRLKNNRAAAALIVAAAALSALAGLTDAARRLGDLVPARRAAVDGEWATRLVPNLFPAGPRRLELSLQELPGGEVAGSVRVRDGDGVLSFQEAGLAEGRRDGDAVRVRWRGNSWLLPGGGGPPVPLDETVRGLVAGDSLRGVYQREGHPPVAITAYRTRPAGTE